MNHLSITEDIWLMLQRYANTHTAEVTTSHEHHWVPHVIAWDMTWVPYDMCPSATCFDYEQCKNTANTFKNFKSDSDILMESSEQKDIGELDDFFVNIEPQGWGLKRIIYDYAQLISLSFRFCFNLV